jgi:hypothetical protein
VINSETVFVLGAGASHPFRFPLGAGLKRLVLNHFLQGEGQGRQVHESHLYNTTAFSRSAVEDFVRSLRYSGLSSVDAFLERRPAFLDIGKATMGIELLLAEHDADLWQEGENWLTYLYNNMIGSSLSEFSNNRVSFVTFNYDRTVEHFFHTSLRNTFGESVEDTATVFEQIPVIHLHGRLGFLPWQHNRSVVPFPTSGEIDKGVMDIVLREIKVVHEDITDGRDKEFTKAKELLDCAMRVYLLGFGFGTLNVERLGLASIKGKVFAGTAFGMTEKETSNCVALCGGEINLRRACPALEFLREYAELN